MSGCLDCETCFYCGRLVSPRHEHDHFPIPRLAGGIATVPACINCHDLKDRFPIGNWSIYMLAPTFKGCEAPLAMELLVALGAAMPERYRPNISTYKLSVRLRPLTTWTMDELVAGVLAATTTEARLYLAKALALSWDWRDREAHDCYSLRPRQDSNLRAAD